MEQIEIRRSDGFRLGGTLTLHMVVAARDWEAVKHLAPAQRDSHGAPALTAEDWNYLRAEAARDGVEL